MKEQEAVVNVKELVKNYGTFPVFDKLSLTINKGSCTGLVGPNGSGKTTLFKCLLGFTDVTYGQISLFGEETCIDGFVKHQSLQTYRKRIGYVPEENVFYEHLSPKEYLQMIACAIRIPKDIQAFRVDALLSAFKLERWAEQMITTLSEGNRQRLSVAAAFIQGPELLLLDEPLNGLDPDGRHYCLNLLSQFIDEGVSELAITSQGTILISSHLLSDIERICTDVIILNHDCQVVAQGSLSEVRYRLTEDASLEDVYLAVVEGGEEVE
ncbi:MAG: ABC transporter ATP-binding protein [Candidatus Heimdallarchaeota archaeon]|nr:MAG: ABC transporter ATP-binding protein [Candidatus Heimdallarchaeota archaeon]